jgi:hypothetical protein
MTPSHPCPWCGSAAFARIKTVNLETTCDAKIGWGNVLYPKMSLLICQGCGHTAWFLNDHAAMLAEVKHEVLQVPVTGYR